MVYFISPSFLHSTSKLLNLISAAASRQISLCSSSVSAEEEARERLTLLLKRAIKTITSLKVRHEPEHFFCLMISCSYFHDDHSLGKPVNAKQAFSSTHSILHAKCCAILA